MNNIDTDIINALYEYLIGARPTRTLIVCAVRQDTPPRFSEEIPRNPKLQERISRKSFGDAYRSALAANPAYHDGAAIVSYSDKEWYVLGWSFRLYPPASVPLKVANVGTAQSSAIHMSCLEEVIACAVCKHDTVAMFANGVELNLHALSMRR